MSGEGAQSLCSEQPLEIQGVGECDEMKRTFLLVSIMLLGCGTLMLAQDAAGQNAPASDNSKMNQRDRDPNAPTADQQSDNPSDRDITQQVRRAINADKTFSAYAHNVKVITQNGQVTLKGPVRSDEEKRAIEAKATAIAGDGKVTSELTVKPKS
jgi:hyperosmotically inducible protein